MTAKMIDLKRLKNRSIKNNFGLNLLQISALKPARATGSY
jgi:hypothetical protein